MTSHSSKIFVLAGDCRQAEVFIGITRLPRGGVYVITCLKDLERMRGIYAPDVFVFGTPSAQLKGETLIHVREQKGCMRQIVDGRECAPSHYPVHIDTVTAIVENVLRSKYGSR